MTNAHHRRAAVLAATLLAAVTATLIALAPPARSAFPGGNGKIAFSSSQGGNLYDIYAMNADGSGTATRLTNVGEQDTTPAWSPDGTKIAFLRCCGTGS